jgi:hypothetical protein
MKRLRGWLFNLAAAVSLVLAIATIILWVRSNRAVDIVSCNFQDGPGSDGIELTSGNARIRFLSTHWDVDPRPNLFTHGLSSFKITHNNPATVARREAKDGDSTFGLRRNLQNRGMPGATGFLLWFPHWFAFALTAPLPIIRTLPLFNVIKARSRRLKGKCVNCGYDLRATPLRCPECGEIPPAAKEAAT